MSIPLGDWGHSHARSSVSPHTHCSASVLCDLCMHENVSKVTNDTRFSVSLVDQKDYISYSHELNLAKRILTRVYNSQVVEGPWVIGCDIKCLLEELLSHCVILKVIVH